MKSYIVNIAGLDHTLLLSDEDAKRLGVKAVEEPAKSAKAAPKPADKARAASNKGA